MNWPFFEMYWLIGVGVALGTHAVFEGKHARYRGATRIVAIIGFMLFWPVFIVAAATMALWAAADR